MANRMDFIKLLVKGHLPEGCVGFSTGLKSWSPFKDKTMRDGFLFLTGGTALIVGGTAFVFGVHHGKRQNAKVEKQEDNSVSQQEVNELNPLTVTPNNQET